MHSPDSSWKYSRVYHLQVVFGMAQIISERKSMVEQVTKETVFKMDPTLTLHNGNPSLVASPNTRNT